MIWFPNHLWQLLYGLSQGLELCHHLIDRGQVFRHSHIHHLGKGCSSSSSSSSSSVLRRGEVHCPLSACIAAGKAALVHQRPYFGVEILQQDQLAAFLKCQDWMIARRCRYTQSLRPSVSSRTDDVAVLQGVECGNELLHEEGHLTTSLLTKTDSDTPTPHFQIIVHLLDIVDRNVPMMSPFCSALIAAMSCSTEGGAVQSNPSQ
jgi:hypothetical protein